MSRISLRIRVRCEQKHQKGWYDRRVATFCPNFLSSGTQFRCTELLHSSAICSLEDCCRKKKKNRTSLEPQKSLCFTKKIVIVSSVQFWRNPKNIDKLVIWQSCHPPGHPHPWGTPPQTLITSTQIKNCSTSRLQLTQTAGLVGFHRDGVLFRICCFHDLQNFQTPEVQTAQNQSFPEWKSVAVVELPLFWGWNRAKIDSTRLAIKMT